MCEKAAQLSIQADRFIFLLLPERHRPIFFRLTFIYTGDLADTRLSLSGQTCLHLEMTCPRLSYYISNRFNNSGFHVLYE